MDKFRDIAYTFEFDNPFENDPQKIQCNKLVKLISEHSDQFMMQDYINKFLFHSVNPNLAKVCRMPITELITDNPIVNDIKDFLSDMPDIPDSLKNWANGLKNVDCYESEEEEEEEEEAEQTTDGTVNEQVTGGTVNEQTSTAQANTAQDTNELSDNVVKLNSNKYAYAITNGVTNYDISSSKLLTLVEVRELSVNIARSLLAKNINVDIEIQKLESKKRKDLIVQIQKYKNIKKIAALLDDDITDMSIDQLEICLEQCKKYHETFKLQEVIKSTMNGGKLLMNAFMPNGIKIGRKRVKIDGIGDELVTQLFDSTTVIGKSFDNVAQKYNFHINDDMLILLKIGESLIKNIKIEDDVPQPTEISDPISTEQAKIKSKPIEIDNDIKLLPMNDYESNSSSYLSEASEDKSVYSSDSETDSE